MPLEIGTLVRMSAIGRRKYTNCPANPHDCQGQVRASRYEDYTYRVVWENGQANSYQEGEIEFVVIPDFDEKAKLKPIPVAELRGNILRALADLCCDRQALPRYEMEIPFQLLRECSLTLDAVDQEGRPIVKPNDPVEMEFLYYRFRQHEVQVL